MSIKQVTIRQLVRQGSKSKLEEWMPCEVVSDGEVIAVLSLPLGVVQPIPHKAMSDKLTELPYAKHKQAQSRW